MIERENERAAANGRWRCSSCGFSTYVERGEPLPECPCGANHYQNATARPRRPSVPTREAMR